MKQTRILLLGLSFMLPVNSALAGITDDSTEQKMQKVPLRLVLGHDRIVDVKGPLNSGEYGITIGNPLILARTLVKVEDRQEIVFKPLNVGSTNVIARDPKGNPVVRFDVIVNPIDLIQLAEDLRKQLPAGANARVGEQTVFVDGTVATPEAVGRVDALIQAKDYFGYVTSLVELSPDFWNQIAKAIQSEIQKTAPNTTARNVNGTIWLEGKVKDITQANLVAKEASLILPETIPGSISERDGTATRLPPRSRIQNFLILENSSSNRGP